MPFPRVSFLLLLILGIVTLSGASRAEAATRTWSGAGATALWSDAGNWDGVAPLPGDDLVFPGVLVVNRTSTNDFAAGTNFRSLTFGGGTYTIDGNAILLGLGIDAQGTVSLTTPLTLAADGIVSGLTVAGPIDLNGHTLTLNVIDPMTTGVISGNGALIKNGNGTLTLATPNTYAGPMTINAGTVSVANATGLGVADGTLANGTILVPAVFPATRATLILQHVAVGNEAISNTDGTIAAAAGGPSSIAGPITLGDNALWSADGPLTLSGVVSGTSALAGSGTLRLTNGGNSLTGGVGFFTGTLVLAVDHALPATSRIGLSPATLRLEGVAQTIGELSGGGGFGVASVDLGNGSTLTIAQTSTTDFGGIFVGSGAIDYVGAGYLRITGLPSVPPPNGPPRPSTFAGPFTIDHGTVGLAFDGNVPAQFTVNSDGRLRYGDGGISGPVTVHGGHLELIGQGNPDGSSGSLLLDSASTFDVGMSNLLVGKLTVTGTVTLANAHFTFTPAPSFKPLAGGSYRIIDNDGTDPVSGTFAGLPEGAILAAGGQTYRISYVGGDGNDVVLTQADYLLTEGATGPFFTTDILIANPNNADAPVHLTFLAPGGGTQTLDQTLPALSQTLLRVNTIPGMESKEFSTVVHSVNGLPLVVERTMSWDTRGYGAHTEHATDGPATTWYFAEGSQGFFHTYLLLANPQTDRIYATVQYLREGETVVTQTYAVEATSRYTVDLSTEPQLADRSFGMIVNFTRTPSFPGPPALGSAERAMYFGDVPLFNGGHDSAGATAPSKTWFLAEGATGPFFETFILLANPGDTDATVTLTYLPAGGTPIVKTKIVPARARLTVNIEPEDPALANAAVSTQIVSTQPILAERSQYWPDPAPNWYEAHNSFGLTTLGTKWGLAEGRVGNVDGYANAQTYILLANPGTTAASVSIMFLRDNAKTPVTKTFTVPPTTRMNIAIGPNGGDAPELTNEHFGALVTSDQPIAVERAVYWDAIGQIWAAGTNATATRLP